VVRNSSTVSADRQRREYGDVELVDPQQIPSSFVPLERPRVDTRSLDRRVARRRTQILATAGKEPSSEKLRILRDGPDVIEAARRNDGRHLPLTGQDGGARLRRMLQQVTGHAHGMMLTE
jgi:hypothetical protein